MMEFMKRGAIYGVGFAAWLAGLCLLLFAPAPVQILSRQCDDVLRRAAAKPPQTDAMAILDIDDESLREFGQWPWPRRLLARITQRLWSEGAAIVAWDVVFAEPDRTSPIRVLEQWREAFGSDVQLSGIPPQELDHDVQFAEALSRGVSVLSLYCELGSGSDRPSARDARETSDAFKSRIYEIGASDKRWLPQARYAVRAIAPLRQAAQSEAFFNTLTDADNIVRRTPMIVIHEGRLLPALALEIFRLLTRSENVGVVWNRRQGDGVAGLRIGPRSVSTDANGCLVLNYRSKSFTRVSMARWWRGEDTRSLSNKVVFIGTSAAGLRDLVGTPMGPDVPGVEVHATAVDNLLAGDALQYPGWMLPAQLGGIALIGAVLVVALARCRAAAGFLTTLLLIALGWGFAWQLMARQGRLVSPAEYTLAVALIYVVETTVKYGAEESARRRARRLFGAMVSPEVMEYLETHPEAISPAGQRVEATVFFSDITNFTALAERLEPEELTMWMNRYFTPMADAIMQEGGYVDKFNGDAIMAVWGAPFPVEDHALRACRAALAQRDRLTALQKEFREKFGLELRVRMGINTGCMTAGNMGSARRHQYTVMGDVVNVAARLEEANKEFGTDILMGEETWRRVNDKMVCRRVADIRVRGREKPLVVYELVGASGDAAGT
jgi:adenylate cyclase